MKPIISPIDRALLLQELSEERFLRSTSKGGNEIYVITAQDSPHTMREVGRLREVAFRDAGGGTGEELDIDAEDLAEDGYKQLIVWDPKEQEIVGGYRYIVSRSTHTPHLSTEHYFHFSDLFRKNYLPYTIELGRSFVQPLYQGSRNNARGIYSLDNLWDGLGALVVQNPDMRYFFGKVTMYESYNSEARNLLIAFLRKYFPDPDRLVEPLNPIPLHIDFEAMAALYSADNYAEDYKTLTREVRQLGENIPPLINSYMSLSPSMKVFDTVSNTEFGGVEETGILITIRDIYQSKSDRYFKIEGSLPCEVR